MIFGSIAIVLFMIVGFFLWRNTNSINSQNSSQTVTKKNGIFTLKAQYVSNSTWLYTVSADLPTPCNEAKVDAIVSESYPDQVNVRVVTSKSSDICAQVIKSFSFDGTFNASEKANISLTLNQ